MPVETGTWSILTTSQWNTMQQMFFVYQVSAIILFFVIIAIVALFWQALPFLYARFISHEVVVGVMDKETRRIRPDRNFKIRNGMYYYKDEPLPFIKKYPGNFLFAGIHFDILDIDLDVITSPQYKHHCAKVIKAGYPNIEALERAIFFSQLPREDIRLNEWMKREGFSDYETMRAKINPKNITIETPGVKKFFTSIQLSELEGYGSQIPEDNIYGEVDDIYEARKPQEAAKREIMRIIPYAIIILVVGVVGVAIYKLFFVAKGG